MAGHVDLAELALLDECLEVTCHVWPVYVLLGLLFDPDQVSPVVGMEYMIHFVP